MQARLLRPHGAQIAEIHCSIALTKPSFHPPSWTYENTMKRMAHLSGPRLDKSTTKPLLVVGPSRNGLGVFTVCPLPRGSVVWDWTGAKQYRSEQLPKPYVIDQYLQVAEGLYIGPDGGPSDAADYANHSCAPNCAIEVPLPRIVIIALRDNKCRRGDHLRLRPDTA